MIHEEKRAEKAPQIRAVERTLRPDTTVTLDSSPRVHSFQRTLGNRRVQTLVRTGHLRTKLTVGRPADRTEREADQVAEAVMRTTDSSVATSETRRAPAPVSPSSTPVSAGVERDVRSSLGGGHRLPDSTRSFFEPRFGVDLSDVRVHLDSDAQRLSGELQAEAFTVGRDIYFGTDSFHPGTTTGNALLAHELTHVLQQTEQVDRPAPTPGVEPQPTGAEAATSRNRQPPSSTASHGLLVQRQDAPEERSKADSEGLGSLRRVPGTELTLIPGPLSPSVFDSRIPLPSSLRLTNALGAGSEPSFVLDISARRLSLFLLQNVDLYTWTRSGTPPGGGGTPESEARISLVNPALTLDPSTPRLQGTARLSVASDYPPHLVAPTELGVSVRSSEIGTFTGRLSFGSVSTPLLTSDFTLTLRYDTDRLERALQPAVAPEGGVQNLWSRFQAILRQAVPPERLSSLSGTLQSLWGSLQSGDLQAALFAARTLDLVRQSIPAGTDLDSLRTALERLATEVTHPGFSLGGRVSLTTPFGALPITGFRAEAPTTVPLERPLPGAPTAFPSTFTAGGVIVAPAGSLYEKAIPALGYSRSSFGETSGTQFTAAAPIPLSLSAISGKEPVPNWFPVSAYAEFSHVRRVADGLDLGVRLVATTPEIFKQESEAPSDPGERLSQSIREFQEASGVPGAISTPTEGWTAFGTVFGRFSGL